MMAGKIPAFFLPVPGKSKRMSPQALLYRRTMDNNFRLVNVYITDMKITEIPQK